MASQWLGALLVLSLVVGCVHTSPDVASQSPETRQKELLEAIATSRAEEQILMEQRSKVENSLAELEGKAALDKLRTEREKIYPTEQRLRDLSEMHAILRRRVKSLQEELKKANELFRESTLEYRINQHGESKNAPSP